MFRIIDQSKPKSLRPLLVGLAIFGVLSAIRYGFDWTGCVRALLSVCAYLALGVGIFLTSGRRNRTIL